jgi:murein DD-endopeptidase MepM/ murein hydrolase activator NlpD
MPRRPSTISFIVLKRRQTLFAGLGWLGLNLMATQASWACNASSLIASSLTAQALKQLNQAVPGGVAIVPLGQAARQPRAAFKESKVLVMAYKSKWYAIVGLSLDTQPGKHQLSFIGQPPELVGSFNVRGKTYPAQHITLKNKRQVNPNSFDLDRINKELALQNKAYALFSDDSPSNVLFDPPVKGRLSSPFGLKRFFNGEPRNPHSGQDFAAPTGTPVRTPASGCIILVGDFMDHGSGLISMFCHLSSIDRQEGDEVKRDDLIAKVGSTGRSTGPHLHWNVSLNNARVDPAIFLTSK